MKRVNVNQYIEKNKKTLYAAVYENETKVIKRVNVA